MWGGVILCALHDELQSKKPLDFSRGLNTFGARAGIEKNQISLIKPHFFHLFIFKWMQTWMQKILVLRFGTGFWLNTRVFFSDLIKIMLPHF